MFKEYSFVFDIDGTLCPIKKKDEKYEDLVPYKISSYGISHLSNQSNNIFAVFLLIIPKFP